MPRKEKEGESNLTLCLGNEMELLLAFKEIYRQLFWNVFEAFCIRGLPPLLKVHTRPVVLCFNGAKHGKVIN